MSMETFKVTCLLESIFQYQGEDHSTDSEPYMWVFMFKIDGESISQDGNSLKGKPTYFYNTGSHGNITDGDSVSNGATIHIPNSIGRWTTSLSSINISLPVIVGYSGGKPTFINVPVEIPGIIGYAAVLFEENLSSEDTMEAGHNALNHFLKSQLEKFINSIDLEMLAFKVQTTMMDKKMSVEEASNKVLGDLIKQMQDTIKEFASPVTTSAIANSMGIGDVICHDVFLGQAFHICNQVELAQGNKSYPWGEKIFNDMIADNLQNPEAGDWAYNLHSCVFPHIELRSIPKDIPVEHRLEVTCVRKSINESGKPFISGIGGMYNNIPWYINRGDAVLLVEEGKKEFFTRKKDGSETNIEVIEYTSEIDHPFLKTVSNSVTEDNLGNLGPCPIFWRYIEPV